jgi:YVTN family beta-propeller protein
MTRWHLQPRTVGLGLVSPTCVVLATIALILNIPIAAHAANTDLHQMGPPARPHLSANGTAGLVFAGQTELGPPGNTPYNIVYDNRTGQLFVTEWPSYLVVVSGSPPVVLHSIFLGPNTDPVGIAYDRANDTVFVGVYPEGIVVVSATTYSIVERLPLGFQPLWLAYDPATESVYSPGPNLTEVNGSTYAVTNFPSPVPAYGGVLAFVYNPVTRYLMVMGFNSQPIVVGWVYAINPVNGTFVWGAYTNLDGQYSGLGVDTQDGSLFLPQAGAPLVVLNGTTGGAEWQVAVPSGEGCFLVSVALAYDANSSDMLVGGCGGVVRSIDTANESVGGPVAVGGSPASIAVDTSTGNPYVLNWDTNSVAVLTANGSGVLSLAKVGGWPTAITIDSSTGTAFVLSSTNVSVINLTSHLLVGSIDVGVNESLVGGFAQVAMTPQSILYNPTDQDVFVANSGNNTVTVFSAHTNRIVATIPVTNSPLALAWNNGTNEVYVACWGYLDVISGATLKVEENMSLGGNLPDGIAYVPSLHEVFVDNNAIESSSNPGITVVSVATNSTIGSIPLPSNASDTGQLVYDNRTGDVYVAGAGLLGLYLSDQDDYIVDPSTLTLVGSIPVGTDPYGIAPETGSNYLLATAGYNGTVSLIDETIGSATYSVTLPIGTLPQGVAFDPASSQAIVVDSGNDSVSYLVPRELYPVTFSETGLPNGTSWSVSLNGSMNTSTTNTTSFHEPNGTYPFEVGGVARYTITTPTGIVTVNGTNVTVAVHFTPTTPETYSVDFTESGLPPGTNWSVTLNGTTRESGQSEIVFQEPNGSYSFSVGPLWIYLEVPGSGTIDVNGGSVSKTIVFSSPCFGGSGCFGRYIVEFTERGLPVGTAWSFTINGSTISGSAASLTFSLQNGTYPFTVGEVAGYSVDPQSGSITVNGSGPNKEITFTPTTSSAPTLWGLSVVDWYILVGVIAGVAVAGIAVAVVRQHRGKVPPDDETSIRPPQGP